jgi:hypothetical protein
MDVVVKEYQANRKSQKQSGHGFIHYPFTEEGIQSVIKATSTIKHVIINSIFFDSGLTPTAESILVSRNRSSPDNINRNSPSLFQQQMSQRVQMQAQQTVQQQYQVPLYERGRNVSLTGNQARTSVIVGEKRTIGTPLSSWGESDFLDNLKNFDDSLVSPTSTQSFFGSNEDRSSFVPSNNVEPRDSPFSFNRLPSPTFVTSAPSAFTSLAASSNTPGLSSSSSLFPSFQHQSSSLSSLPMYSCRN